MFPEQFEKISELKNIDLSTIANTFKDTKVGEGINFLWRTIVGLTKTLPLLLSELTETGMKQIRKEIAAMLSSSLTLTPLQVTVLGVEHVIMC